MAKYIETTDVSKIWNSLGTFWGQFPDKDLITQLWQSYYDSLGLLYNQKNNVAKSKSMVNLVPVLSLSDITYEPIFDGDDSNIVTLSTLSGIEIDNYTLSIPTLSGIETGEILTEETDYTLVNKKYIKFLTTPTPDPNNTEDTRITLYANNVYRHNPVLWNIHASGIGLTVSSLDNEDYLPYINMTASGIDRTIEVAEHYKYLIWGLEYIKSQPPTIQNLKDGFGISRGLPFLYRAGTVDSLVDSTYTVSVSGLTGTYDTYVMPSGITPTISVGESYPQFKVIASGIELYDYVNSYDYIRSLTGVNDFNYTSYIDFYCDPTVSGLQHSTEFHSTYVNSLIPAGLNYVGQN